MGLETSCTETGAVAASQPIVSPASTLLLIFRWILWCWLVKILREVFPHSSDSWFLSNVHANVGSHLERKFPHITFYVIKFLDTESDVTSKPPDSPEGSRTDTSDTGFFPVRILWCCIRRLVTLPKWRLIHIYYTSEFFFLYELSDV